ncbi:MAG TPA: DUF4873 domain-containing protein [Pseudonocardia sp.]|nr:DUF4873 domain-containing protein [Pseudonocardia sp.]
MTGPGGDHGDEPDPGYTGPATLVIEGSELPVEVDLRGYFQPIDGRYRWYGRVAADPELTRRVRGNRARVLLRTPAGERPAEISDPDMWDRFRVAGEGSPPFSSGFEPSG